MLADLENQVATSAASLAQAQADVDAKSTALQAAVQDRDQADQVRKEKDVAAKELKNLGGTVAARHGRLKALRDDITKSEQAGLYAVAYWLLRFAFAQEFDGDDVAKPVKPDELPSRLIDALKAVADAENTQAGDQQKVRPPAASSPSPRRAATTTSPTPRRNSAAELEQVQPAEA